MTFTLRNQITREVSLLPPGVVGVGREDDNQLFIDHISVSRRHARLINRDDGLYVEDLGSSNGTSVDGNAVQGIAKLNVGDLVKFGAMEFRIEPELLNDLGLPPAAIRRAPATPVTGRDLRRATERLDDHPAVARLPSGPLPDPTMRERQQIPGESAELKSPASARVVAKASTPYEPSMSNPMPADAAAAGLSKISGRIPAPAGPPPSSVRAPAPDPSGVRHASMASSRPASPSGGGAIFVPLGYVARVTANGLEFFAPNSPELANTMAVTLVDSPNAPRRPQPAVPAPKAMPLYLSLLLALGAGLGLGVVLGIVLYKWVSSAPAKAAAEPAAMMWIVPGQGEARATVV